MRFELQPVDHGSEGTSLAEAPEERDRTGQIELPDGNAETQRQETVRRSVQRDSTVVREMKRLYDHKYRTYVPLKRVYIPTEVAHSQ